MRIVALVLFVWSLFGGSVARAQTPASLEQCVRTCYRQVVTNPVRVGECVDLSRLARDADRAVEAIVAFIRHRVETSLRLYPHADITNFHITALGNGEYHFRGTLINAWRGLSFPLQALVAFNGRQCRLLEGRVWGTTLSQYLARRI